MRTSVLRSLKHRLRCSPAEKVFSRAYSEYYLAIALANPKRMLARTMDAVQSVVQDNIVRIVPKTYESAEEELEQNGYKVTTPQRMVAVPRADYLASEVVKSAFWILRMDPFVEAAE